MMQMSYGKPHLITDFNENDPDWKVEWAYNIQKNKLLTPFYTLNVIIVPLDVWFRWF